MSIKQKKNFFKILIENQKLNTILKKNQVFILEYKNLIFKTDQKKIQCTKFFLYNLFKVTKNLKGNITSSIVYSYFSSFLPFSSYLKGKRNYPVLVIFQGYIINNFVINIKKYFDKNFLFYNLLYCIILKTFYILKIFNKNNLFRLAVRTLLFHSKNMGSIPIKDVIF